MISRKISRRNITVDDVSLFKKSINAEEIDLAKLGWTESRKDKKILSYVRGYVWRNYGIRIKKPLDWVIFYMINDALSEQQRSDRNG